MKKLQYVAGFVGFIALVACSPNPTPLCDREAQEWNKFNTQEDECHVALPSIGTSVSVSDHTVGDHVPDRVGTPDADEPEEEGPTDNGQPSDRNRGNNGWGNGDDPAPGRSLNRNRAENSDKTHRNHGQGRKN